MLSLPKCRFFPAQHALQPALAPLLVAPTAHRPVPALAARVVPLAGSRGALVQHYVAALPFDRAVVRPEAWQRHDVGAAQTVCPAQAFRAELGGVGRMPNNQRAWILGALDAVLAGRTRDAGVEHRHRRVAHQDVACRAGLHAHYSVRRRPLRAINLGLQRPPVARGALQRAWLAPSQRRGDVLCRLAAPTAPRLVVIMQHHLLSDPAWVTARNFRLVQARVALTGESHMHLHPVVVDWATLQQLHGAQQRRFVVGGMRAKENRRLQGVSSAAVDADPAHRDLNHVRVGPELRAMQHLAQGIAEAEAAVEVRLSRGVVAWRAGDLEARGQSSDFDAVCLCCAVFAKMYQPLSAVARDREADGLRHGAEARPHLAALHKDASAGPARAVVRNVD
mmetsp:Transcript_13254/g.26001  ORF Transcript_13254/g.26001 Transcript_13254/m.26001 type:complete len:393 (-) Transcript_13254:1004-2182(-)